MQSQVEYKQKTFGSIEHDPSWSFNDLKRKDTSYLTHCYHRYPAKFIPQLARRLIVENSVDDELVCDPFYGSGSAILEALLCGRRALGTDINPLAFLVTKAKTTPIDQTLLREHISSITQDVQQFNGTTTDLEIPKELSGWFDSSTLSKLYDILDRIETVTNLDVRIFFLCAFSHILKVSSYWNNGSIKPHKKPDKFSKRDNDPVRKFVTHLLRMETRNADLISLLSQKITLRLNEYRDIQDSDARHIQAEDDSVSLVVTSPPYVISYEYRDIHSLSLYLLRKSLRSIPSRKCFIGSFSRKSSSTYLKSTTGEFIVRNLLERDTSLALTVNSYFLDMQECLVRMENLLRSGGRVAIVIGNTTLRGVKILNAEVFSEILSNIGMSRVQVIKRQIPFKSLPSMRDPKSGRFVTSKASNISVAYPHEYLLVFQK